MNALLLCNHGDFSSRLTLSLLFLLFGFSFLGCGDGKITKQAASVSGDVSLDSHVNRTAVTVTGTIAQELIEIINSGTAVADAKDLGIAALDIYYVDNTQDHIMIGYKGMVHFKDRSVQTDSNKIIDYLKRISGHVNEQR